MSLKARRIWSLKMVWGCHLLALRSYCSTLSILLRRQDISRAQCLCYCKRRMQVHHIQILHYTSACIGGRGIGSVKHSSLKTSCNVRAVGDVSIKIRQALVFEIEVFFPAKEKHVAWRFSWRLIVAFPYLNSIYNKFLLSQWLPLSLVKTNSLFKKDS